MNYPSPPIPTDLAYLNYWKRKELRDSHQPHFPVKSWWTSEGLCELEQIIFDQIKSKSAILDVGAGDLQMQHKFHQAGFQGMYHTQDIGQEFTYTYATVAEIHQTYGAILCFDVIEHLELNVGLELLHELIARLEPGGILVIQTPNARCVRNPLISDMTHLHCYNILDLWSYLTALGLQANGCRVVLNKQKIGFLQKLSGLLSRYIITQHLGLDYADNIILFAKKT
jgi:2-polyprenyl-3-methyl-5-hydroxy-6-metoxy-1,4-benzoquinol methylase